MFVNVRGLTFHVQRGGAEVGTPLVFLNSLGSDLRIWDAVAPHVAHLPLVRYDQRGHGLTDAPRGPYTIREHTDDLLALLDALELSKAALVGISVGGMIALDFAAAYPERLKALVLCDTGAKIGTVEGWNTRIEAVRTEGLETVAERVVPGWLTAGFAEAQPAAFRGYCNMLSRTPPEGYSGTCAALRDADLRDGCSQVRAPTLVLCGEEDSSTPPSLAQELAAAIPGAQLHLIERAAHLPCLEQPETLARRVSDFLEEIYG